MSAIVETPSTSESESESEPESQSIPQPEPILRHSLLNLRRQALINEFNQINLSGSLRRLKKQWNQILQYSAVLIQLPRCSNCRKLHPVYPIKFRRHAKRLRSDMLDVDARLLNERNLGRFKRRFAMYCEQFNAYDRESDCRRSVVDSQHQRNIQAYSRAISDYHNELDPCRRAYYRTQVLLYQNLCAGHYRGQLRNFRGFINRSKETSGGHGTSALFLGGSDKESLDLNSEELSLFEKTPDDLLGL